jgi:DUF917 family protein
MPDKTIRTEQEVEDLLRGLVLLGTGGGGHPKVGRQYLLSHINAGQEIRWKDLSNVPDDAWACCVFGMGSVAPHDPLSDAERNRLGYVGDQVAYPMVEAVRELERYTGASVQALVSFELRYGVHVYYSRCRQDIARWVLDRAIKFYKLQREVQQ